MTAGSLAAQMGLSLDSRLADRTDWPPPIAFARYIAWSASVQQYRRPENGGNTRRRRQCWPSIAIDSAVDLQRRIEAIENPPRHRRRIGGGPQVVDQHGELVAAETGRHVARPHAADQPPGNLAQRPIAHQMAPTVVDRLEAVQVDEADGEQIVDAARARSNARPNRRSKQAAVGQARQRVMAGNAEIAGVAAGRPRLVGPIGGQLAGNDDPMLGLAVANVRHVPLGGDHPSVLSPLPNADDR